MLNKLTKILAKEAKSLVRSEARSAVKKKVKDLYKNWKSKTPDDIRNEVMNTIGYSTTHYTLGKDNELKFKNSPVFIHEWLMNSPETKNKLVMDEESGQIFFDDDRWDNAIKLGLIEKFRNQTGSQAPSLHTNFEQALKLLVPTDFNAKKFKALLSDWDINKPSVINTFLKGCFGELQTDEAYANMIFKKWVIGTAKRAMEPGSSLDGCLVLKGTAGIGKTQFFRKLLPTPFDGRTGEVLGNIKDPRKFAESILGKTIACFDELTVLDNDKVENTFKQLLSSQNIDVRLAWRRDPQRYGLRQGFSGTTNAEKFIKDEFMSRRFWVIELGEKRLDFDYLGEHRADLWREAVYLVSQGINCYLTPEEQKLVEKQNIKFISGKEQEKS